MTDKIIFIDRDGVINEDPAEKKYITSIKEFKFIPAVIEALKQLSTAGYKIFIISNQQGVAKNIFSQEKLNEITGYMLDVLRDAAVKIEGVRYCTHLKEADCACRKPKAGLITKAVEMLNVDLEKTFFIGDTERDMKAGKSAGCKTVLVLCGKTKNSKEIENWQAKPDYIYRDLKEAVDFIINASAGS